MKERIPLTQPFSIEHTMKSVRGQNPLLVYCDPELPIFTKAVPLVSGRKIPVTVNFIEAPQGPMAELDLHQPCDQDEVQQVRSYFEKMLSNQIDLKPFYAQIKEEPIIGEILPDLHGLKILLEPNLFQNLIRTIIGQQMNLSFAAALVSRITELYGTSVETNGHKLFVFPEPETLARLETADLQALQFSQRKAEYVIGLSRLVSEGALDIYALPALSDEEVYKRLIGIRGVGKWTIECFLLFGVGRTDFFPADDIGLKNAMKLLWGMESQPSSPVMQGISHSWSPWRSYAAYYLWAWLDEWKLQQKALKIPARKRADPQR